MIARVFSAKWCCQQIMRWAEFVSSSYIRHMYCKFVIVKCADWSVDCPVTDCEKYMGTKKTKAVKVDSWRVTSCQNTKATKSPTWIGAVAELPRGRLSWKMTLTSWRSSRVDGVELSLSHVIEIAGNSGNEDDYEERPPRTCGGRQL